MPPIVEINLFASLSRYEPENKNHFPVNPGDSAEDVLKSLGVPLDEAKLIFINGIRKSLSSVLQNGDRLGVFPPVGGG
ncbi:Molybdopterin converting factor, small subunit [Candidatus Desulfarcum epimagneticum]|uniref:Molybdopterin converting factor, small subunit n=1 Tax=uncultured Desulfobacteraceae bacterium TaxID=218296 RepID=A0A484HID4_9BACT|nr:Molybdopterin converting factor, small subunit [uncultured Desulfobacteraceae bacterium]